MKLFLTISLLACQGTIPNKCGSEVDQGRIFISIDSIESYQEMDYVLCKDTSRIEWTCKKQIYAGCKYQLKNGKEYIAQEMCSNL